MFDWTGQLFFKYNPVMEIYGLAGGNEAGKSTLGEYLREQVDSPVDLEFSDPISEVANRWLEKLPDNISHESHGALIRDVNTWIENLPEAIQSITGYDCDWRDFLIDADDEDRYTGMHEELVSYMEKVAKGNKTQSISRENKSQHVSLLRWLGYSVREIVEPGVWDNTIRSRIESLLHNELLTVGGVRFESDVELVRSVGGMVIKVTRPELQSSHTYATETASQAWSADIDVINNGNLCQLRMASELIRSVSNQCIINTVELEDCNAPD